MDYLPFGTGGGGGGGPFFVGIGSGGNFAFAGIGSFGGKGGGGGGVFVGAVILLLNFNSDPAPKFNFPCFKAPPSKLALIIAPVIGSIANISFM